MQRLKRQRRLAVKLPRRGYDLVHIEALLGHKSESSTKRLVSQYPVRLAEIVARDIQLNWLQKVALNNIMKPI